MAGPFAHITLVDSFCQHREELLKIDHLSDEIRNALLGNNEYCELGAISPDCPYFVLLNNEANGWANIMHYWNTADFIRRAIPYINNLEFDSVNWRKCVAWLFGYVGHVVTDLVIHPMVNMKVGDYYAGNQTAHRRCEMHQDVYIFNKRGHGEVITAEYFSGGGPSTCCDDENNHKLSPAIRDFWCYCLKDVPLGSVKIKNNLPVPHNLPNPDDWFYHCVSLIDDFADEPVFFFRRTVDAIKYIPSNEVDQGYIYNLETPEGFLSYDGIFERALQCVKSEWNRLGLALTEKKPELFTMANCDLDKGYTEQFFYWRNST